MAVQEIPTRTDLPSYEQQVTLDGVVYTLALYFNPRMGGTGRWMATLADKNRNMICGPVPVTVSWPLFDRFIAAAIPPGSIVAFDTSGAELDPGQFDLGNRVRLLYIEQGTVF